MASYDELLFPHLFSQMFWFVLAHVFQSPPTSHCAALCSSPFLTVASYTHTSDYCLAIVVHFFFFFGAFVCSVFDVRSSQNQFRLLRWNLNTLQRQSTTSHNPRNTVTWKPDFLKSEITAYGHAQMLLLYKTAALFPEWSWSYNSSLSVSHLSLICYGHCHLPPPLLPPLVMWA